MEEDSQSADSFKKPILPLKDPSLDSFKKPAIPISDASTKDSSQNTAAASLIDSSEVSDIPKVANKKREKSQSNVPLPYEEPEWHGHPPPNYSLETIKNGTFISTLSIKASLVVFGRLDVCDVVFEHPSVSRYHAVIQYCKGDDTHPKGFYLYDLGSTHGTFLNKSKVSPKIYYKLKVGYILKFGGSSRLHIFQGPEEEEEVEVAKPKDTVNEAVEEICTWGMGEEAVEEEDMTENPFAISATNEDLYIEDPKKTLRGWFEREGYELEYKVEEKGFRTFCCTIRLPIDNPTGDYLPVEASVSGKKKEAVIACALEACRTLDRLGLLRQSHHESRQRKRKKWEENDYYDSDEDTFYDRTGEIEKRREMRKRLAKKVEVNNFETISAKLTSIQSEMEDIKNKISVGESKDSSDSTSKEIDTLDMYMSNLSESGSSLSDKFERRKLKLRLIELEKEKEHLEKLANIAKPVNMPALKKNLGFIGKRPQSKLKLPSATKSEDTKPKNDDEQIEEDDSDEEASVNVNQEQINKEDSNPDINKEICSKNDDTAEPAKYGLILNTSATNNLSNEHISSIDSSMDVVEIDSFKSRADISEEKKNKKGITDSAESISNVDKTLDLLKEDSKSKVEENKDKIQKKSKKRDVLSKTKVDVYKTDSNEYCTWMPPNNQSGDGMTHLNAKYGY
ncbi:kanadaptin [Parasteatoda tepidariorum]|uniref:kanadaptin n=1 Tax=Parasteatoda tepidariorum TaxID=114398 RepID=UPI00077FAE7A|nr:kanadaptin [Parasteatoda tepidariorum]